MSEKVLINTRNGLDVNAVCDSTSSEQKWRFSFRYIICPEIENGCRRYPQSKNGLQYVIRENSLFYECESHGNSESGGTHQVILININAAVTHIDIVHSGLIWVSAFHRNRFVKWTTALPMNERRKLLTAVTKCKLCQKVSIKLNYQFMRAEFKKTAGTALFSSGSANIASIYLMYCELPRVATLLFCRILLRRRHYRMSICRCLRCRRCSPGYQLIKFTHCWSDQRIGGALPELKLVSIAS